MINREIDGVSFFTCCYEADWEFFLKQGRLKEMIERCNYTFANTNLVINNVNNKDEVIKYAEQAVRDGIINNYFFSEDYADMVLKNFSIKRKDFRLDGFDGYYYSTAPLTAIYLCTTTYILYFMGDCMLNEKYAFNWIDEGVKRLQNEKVLCVTPLWSYYNQQVERNISGNNDFAYYDHGFSDQCFLAKTQKLNSDIYNEYNAKSEIFPIYGGNHFERRIFCFINNKNFLRCIFKNIIYTHNKLMKPEFIRVEKANIKIKILYFIARIKRQIRRRNIFVKFLLK